jgi:hypothetical protein
VIHRSGKRRQYDVIARRDGRTLLAECKQWSGGRYRLSALKQAVAKHRERARFYETITREDAVPLLVTLIEEEIRVVDGVPLVPVHRLNAFIAELDMYADGLLFADPPEDPDAWAEDGEEDRADTGTCRQDGGADAGRQRRREQGDSGTMPDVFYQERGQGSMTERRFWIIVASKEHAMTGVNGGFAMANHGKRSGLARMHAGDGIVYYSPKLTYSGHEPLHAFTALGEVADDEIVQVEMGADFRPFRRNVNYFSTGEVKIGPLLPDLGFIRDKSSWGSVFRFGLVQIPGEDFNRIRQAFGREGTQIR